MTVTNPPTDRHITPRRIDAQAASPEAYKAVLGVEQHVRRTVDHTLLHLVKLRASVINGCAYCVNSHTAALRKLGTSSEALGEILAIAGLFNMTNALADGYQVEPDILPPLE